MLDFYNFLYFNINNHMIQLLKIFLKLSQRSIAKNKEKSIIYKSYFNLRLPYIPNNGNPYNPIADQKPNLYICHFCNNTISFPQNHL